MFTLFTFNNAENYICKKLWRGDNKNDQTKNDTIRVIMWEFVSLGLKTLDKHQNEHQEMHLKVNTLTP